MAHDVFISYASSDKAIADAVCSQLESIHRIRCWIAPRDVTPGANWAGSIIDALDESKIMVLIFSSSANASMQIEREVERAVHKGISIIPLRIENTTPTKTLEYFISAPHWLDALSVPLELHINKLAAAVKSLLAKAGQAPAQQTLTDLVATVTKIDPATEPKAPVTLAAAKETASTDPARARKWLLTAAAAAVVLAMVVYGLRSTSRPSQDADNVSQTAAEPASPPAEANTSPSASTSSGQGRVAPEGTTPPAIAPARVPSPGAPGIAGSPAATRTGASPAQPRPTTSPTPNLLIDFRNTVDEGMISLDVDGQTIWSELLGEGLKSKSPDTPAGPGIPEGSPVSASVTLRRGTRQATVTLLNKDGEVRDTKSVDLDLVAQPSQRTLQIRLSRFKKDLELKIVDTPVADEKSDVTPVSDSKAAAAKPSGSSK